MLKPKEFKHKKIVLASQKSIKKLQPWVDYILAILGHPGALVTDESYLTDFFDFGKESKTARKKFCDKLGFHTDSDSIIEIAQQLKNHFEGRYPTKTRKLISGNNVLEFNKMVQLRAIESKCPDKWHFVDAETGDVWQWNWIDKKFEHSLLEKKIIQAIRKIKHGKSKRLS